MAEDTESRNDIYTKDGTVDYRGNPANKKQTGTWRACPFILGNHSSLYFLKLFFSSISGVCGLITRLRVT